MSQIVLDADAFKALSSETRLQILKALDVRPLTVSELGRLLDLNKATIFEHLKQLLAAELAKKVEDEGRKWVYYKLTWKGRNVLHPENVQFMLLLGTAALSLGGLLAQLGFLLSKSGPPTKSTLTDEIASTPQPEGTSADRAADAGQTAPETAPGSLPESDANPFWQDPGLWILIVLSVLVLVTGILASRHWLQRRRIRMEMGQKIHALEEAAKGSPLR